MTSPAADKVWFPVPAGVWLLLLLAVLVACYTDLRAMRIPNWLTFPLLAAGLIYGAWVGGLPGVGQSLMGLAIAGGIFIAAYALAGGGAGDAKLMMALGAWLGAERATLLVLSVAIAGALISVVIVTRRGGLRDVPLLVMQSVYSLRVGFMRMLGGRAPVQQASSSPAQARFKGWYPYAPAIAAGTAGAWWYWERFGSIV
jgi:prepilin peptidase CpaA